MQIKAGQTVQFRLSDDLSWATAEVVEKDGQLCFDRGKGKDLVPHADSIQVREPQPDPEPEPEEAEPSE